MKPELKPANDTNKIIALLIFGTVLMVALFSCVMMLITKGG